MAADQYAKSRISTWDNSGLSTSFNPSRSIQNVSSSMPMSPTSNYVVPFSRYSSQNRPQLSTNEQQYQQPKYSSQAGEIFQPFQTPTSETKMGWCAKHVSVTRVVGLLFGLIVTGVPLAVMVTMYVQLFNSTSSNNTTATNTQSSTVSNINSVPYQCTTYTTNTDNTRLATYYCGSCYCDSGLSGWYRFTGAAGTKLATTPVSQGYCGANYPGWFNGTLPTTIYETTVGTVCVYLSGNICYSPYSISAVPVTNCSGFYVYYLTPMSYCYSRYCTQ